MLNFETNRSDASNNVTTRVLNEKSLNLIRDELKLTDFSIINKFENVDERWHVIKRILLSIIDKYAPSKKLRLKKRDRFPWVDNELHYHIAIRDKLHEIAVDSNTSRINSAEWIAFRAQRSLTQRLYRIKMTDYFRDKCCSAFKSSKVYWKFYKSVIKTKKSISNRTINCINSNGTTFYEKNKIADTFNHHFANLTAGVNSECSYDQSKMSINDNFLLFKRENILKVESSFSFKETNPIVVSELINKLDSSSSPGVSSIPTKVIKHCATEISTVCAELFNYCIQTCTIPIEFKSAIVNPLFKGKGDCTSPDDYRGICCLPPLAKIFEHILNDQIVNYFESNNLFSAKQHGFRANHPNQLFFNAHAQKI